MKKRFTKFLAALALLVFMTPSLAGWGQTRTEEVYSTCLFGTNYNSQGVQVYTSTWSTTNGDFTWTIVNGNNNNNGWNHVRFGRKNNTSVGQIKTAALYSEPITKVELTIDALTASSINSINLYTSTDNSTWGNAVGSFTKATGIQTVTLPSPTANLYYKIEFDCASGSNNGLIQISKVEYYHNTGSGSTVATPTFDPAGGTYTEEQLVEIECETENAVIYYTTDGTTPDNTSTEYDPDEGVTISETTTLKAIAYVGNDASSVASATYTIVTPLTTISQIFAKATEVGSTQTDVYVTFGNWIVVGKSYSNAYVSDGQYGLNLYKSGGINFEIGDQLSGTVATKVQLYTGGAELVGLSKPFEGLTVTSNQTFEPYPISLADLVGQGIYFGSYVDLGNLTYTSGGKFTDGNNHEINPYNTFSIQNYPTLEAGKTYRVKGVFIRYNNTTERIAPVYASDFTEYTGPSIEATPSPFTAPSYVVGTAEPEYETLIVSGSNLTANISLTLNANSDFEMSTDLDNWSSSLTLTQTNGSVTNAEVAIRLKAGLAKGDYVGTVTLSSTDAQNVEVSLSGTVTGQTYAINIDDDITGGTIAADLVTAEEGATITLTATPDAAYNFSAWLVLEADQTTEVTVTNNQFTMPACQVYVTAEFTAKPTHNVTIASGIENGTVTADPTSAYAGQAITLTVTPGTNCYLTSLTATYVDENQDTQELTITNNTFVMPNYNVTVTATFASNAFEGSFVLYSGTLTEGDYLIVYDNGAMNNVVTSSRFGFETVSPTQNIITDPSKDIVWHIEASETEGYWTIFNAKKGQYANNGNGNATTVSLVDPNYAGNGAKWQVTGTDTYEFRNKANVDYVSSNPSANVRYLRKNGTSGFASYTTGYGDALTLYKFIPPTAPVWSALPTPNIYTGNEYELTLTDYVTGYPAPNITLATEVSSSLYEYENGYFTFQSDNAGTYEFTFTATNAADHANVTLTITVSNPAQVTYRYSNNGVLGAATSILQGHSIELTTSENLNSKFTFAGWTDNLNDVEHNIYAAETSYQVNNDVVLYAVYAHEVEGTPVTTYNKVTSISEGDYLIVYETGNLIFDGSLETLDAAGNTQSVTIIDDAIESNVSNDAAVFTISEVTGGYTIQSASGYYIGQTNDSNGLTTNTTTTYTNSISFDIEKNANIVSGGAYLRYNSASNQTRFRYYKSSSYTSQQAIQLYKKETTTPTTTVYYTHVQLTDITANTNISLIPDPIVIPSGSVIDAGSYLTNTNPANLIIEDGGRLIVYNEGVQATVKKNVEKATTWGAEKSGGVDGWYFIASPVNGAAFPTGTINDQDIYQLDWVNKKWLNLQNDAHSSLLDAGFRRGTGYLYASKDGNTLSVAGEIQPLSGNNDATVTLAVDGWNLIGNPLTCKVTVGCDFSELNGGSAVIPQTSGSTINPFQGIAVYGDAGDKVSFTKATAQNAAAPSNNNSLQMSLAKKVTSRGEVSTKVVDNAVVSFNNSKGMPKFNMLGGNAKLYIPQNNEEYAVVFSDRQGDMPLNFKADELGTYTINFETSDRTSLQGIYLIDMLEEQEIDLSVEPSYTFIGSPADRAARFKIVFRTGFENSPNDIFAYQNGSDIIVCGEGELQIFDVMGRIVAKQYVNGVVTWHAASVQNGVYILKLNEKTQKIVVR